MTILARGAIAALFMGMCMGATLKPADAGNGAHRTGAAIDGRAGRQRPAGVRRTHRPLSGLKLWTLLAALCAVWLAPQAALSAPSLAAILAGRTRVRLA